ncbi:hybrid sensor histidine kinase/response regulator [Caulobacter sp. B11]|uniref:ATP-binding protein n=1 Tax=Caulobacter sp. B11 TaxID=2048899 RepID=UPI000C12D0DA|nr:ATP-binding protein [Caulobacter sp. B11]PHY13618.1 hybrid sensor histidine kinase/response regulator [Caulobacter sp. B11]
MVAMAVVHAGAVTLFWRSGQPPLMALALMVLAGGALNNVASGVDSRALFYLGATPYAVSLATMPIWWWQTSRGQVAILTVSVIFFMVAVHGTWRRLHLARKATIAAREDADLRRIQAEDAVADRAAMAAIVSHELRTPLSAILAGAHLIRRGSHPTQVAATAELIVDAGHLMTGLLTDLLDQAKIEARAMNLETRDFDLLGAVRDATRFWTAQAQAKGLSLREPPLDQSAVWVSGDPFRLRQILNNLLSNAVKFTEQGVIELRVEVAAADDQRLRVVIEVEDQGPGISEDTMARLFTPYAQASQETARTYGGTGLGLAVSRQLARLMGGELEARPGLSGGATFRLALSFAVGQEAARASAPALDGAGPALSTLKILAVDDHEVNRRTLALVLEPLGVALSTATDGVAALRRLEAERFDIVLMDVNMPGLDGCEATRRLRAGAGLNRDTPVIGFSAGVAAEEVQACRDAGMTDWVAKPLDIRALYDALDRAVA